MLSLKQQIRDELKNTDFPNLKFFYTKEALLCAPEILQELLEEEKQDFAIKLATPDTEITYELFEEFSELGYYFSILGHYQGVNNDEQIRKIIEDFEPEYIDFGNEISYSKRYFEMVKIVRNGTDLSQEQIKILDQEIESYEVRWIALDQTKQEILKKINKDLSELSQKFSNNALDSQNEFEYIITDESIISEVPDDDKAVAQKNAENKKVAWYLFDASGSSYGTIMKYCSDSSVRKHFYESRNSFATTGKYNNNPIILEILKLREQKAVLLGFKNYSELSLHFKMAESPEQVKNLFWEIAEQARPKAILELQEIREYFNLKELDIWDLGYYANKLKQEKYTFDSRELKKYFVYENVLAGLFETTQRLYNIEMKKTDIVSYSEDVEIYEVYRNGTFLSYYFTDFFYTPLKRQGAWADLLREKHGAYKKIVLNTCNFQKWTDGVTLLTLSDVETLYHEFGHAIHEMLSISEHSELSGFHVEHDFVELPSQLLENWARDEVGMKLFAKHFENWDEIPKAMLEKLKILEMFWNAQMILAQNTYAMLDMSLHSEGIPTSEAELDARVRKNAEQNSIFPVSDTYSPHTTFTHIFDWGYAAGYYSYMWAEIIEKEVWQAFKSSWDVFSPEIATKFHDLMLSAGSTKKASELFQDFFGREVSIDAFLKEKGLV